MDELHAQHLGLVVKIKVSAAGRSSGHITAAGGCRRLRWGRVEIVEAEAVL
jgi:hypothetical protein